MRRLESKTMGKTSADLLKKLYPTKADRRGTVHAIEIVNYWRNVFDIDCDHAVCFGCKRGFSTKQSGSGAKFPDTEKRKQRLQREYDNLIVQLNTSPTEVNKCRLLQRLECVKYKIKEADNKIKYLKSRSCNDKNWNKLEKSHLIAARYGGPSEFWNVIYLCHWCHKDMDNCFNGQPKDYYEMIKWVKSRFEYFFFYINNICSALMPIILNSNNRSEDMEEIKYLLKKIEKWKELYKRCRLDIVYFLPKSELIITQLNIASMGDWPKL